MRTCLITWVRMSTSQTARHHKVENIGILTITRYLLWRLGGPQGQSGQVRKTLPASGCGPWTVQPIASCNTNYAILAHSNSSNSNNSSGSSSSSSSSSTLISSILFSQAVLVTAVVHLFIPFNSVSHLWLHCIMFSCLLLCPGHIADFHVVLYYNIICIFFATTGQDVSFCKGLYCFVPAHV